MAPAPQAHAQPAIPASNIASAAAPTGLWATQNHDAVIQIAPCGSNLCGQIVGMVLQPQEPTPKDWAGGTQCHLTIIQASPHTDDSGQVTWTGSIVNPRSGSSYSIILRQDASHNLLLRGYIGLPIFGETQTWSPYQGNLADNCRLNQPVG